MRFTMTESYYQNWHKAQNSADVTVRRGDTERTRKDISYATWYRLNMYMERISRVEYLHNPKWFPGAIPKTVSVICY